MKILITSCGVGKYLQYLAPRLPQAEWIFDRTRRQMDTYMRALAAAGDDECVIMEDDVILTVNFEDKLTKAVQAKEGACVINFFCIRDADLTIGSRWDRNFNWSQCVYFPRGYAKSLLDFCREYMAGGEIPRQRGSDTVVRAWLDNRREQHWIEVPHLVQHRPDKSQVDPRRSTKRQSKTFVDPWL